MPTNAARDLSIAARRRLRLHSGFRLGDDCGLPWRDMPSDGSRSCL